MGAKIALGCRYLLGLVFLIFGINGLLAIFAGGGFIPIPPPNEAMAAAMGGLFASKYIMPLVKIIEVVAGGLLLSGRMQNLAIVLLGPIVVNILGLHLFLDPGGLPIAIFVTALWFVVLNSRCDQFKRFLSA